MSESQCRAVEIDGKRCSARTRGGPICKHHMSFVPPHVRNGGLDAMLAHIAAIPKVKGYDEHGSYPSPQAAVCAVCGKLSWICPHDWSLRIPQERFEAFGRGLPWPCVAADVIECNGGRERVRIRLKG